MENELNRTLILRTTKSIQPTKKGESLYQYAKEILHLRNCAINELLQVKEEAVIAIKLAASTIPNQYILPELLPAFNELHPNTSFYVMQEDSEGVIEQVINNTVDMGLVGTIGDKKSLYAYCKNKKLSTPVQCFIQYIKAYYMLKE